MTANKKTMVHFLIILVVIVACSLFHYSKEKEDVPETEWGLDGNSQETETRKLVYRLLSKLGCDPKYTEEDRIQFEYQGVFFLMDAVDDCKFVNIIWPWCHSFSKFDIDEFARVRKVINEINVRGTCTLFYIQYPESDEVAVHIRKNLLFVPQIPQIEGYLQVTLKGFFEVARALDVEKEKVKMQECESNS